MARRLNRYAQIIEAIFFRHYRPGDTEVGFERKEINEVASELGLRQIRNVGDAVYAFRFRAELPDPIRATAPSGLEWVIRQAGISQYRFVLTTFVNIVPTEGLVVTKILDATPGMISSYALDDEQALLAKLRYNRLIDIFTGITCYSLQSHLRTTVPDMGQVEVDEIYIGVDSRGAHYVLPVQAKSGRDKLGVVQVEQDLAMCASKFPGMICKPIAAHFMGEEVIALFEFEQSADGVGIVAEKHYKLVMVEEISPEEIARYAVRSPS
ncbi:MAG: endonuclease [Caldilineaceae bacterium]|nr:endonuclease [Caldilineaceae bacterium]